MRILFALDEHSYSANTIPLVARLGNNTWADITMLITKKTGSMSGAKKGHAGREIKPKAGEVLDAYHAQLLGNFDPLTSPYSQPNQDDNETSRIRKKITTLVREGNPAREILTEAKEEECDLIVIGCSSKDKSSWRDAGKVPLWVAGEAACSVLVMQEDKAINKILCCLDHDHISQDSLEMISQMVTLFDADLDIVVLTEGEDLRQKIEKKLAWLINYYSSRDIFPFIELVKLSSLETFVSQKARWGLVAMWMGKPSILARLFPSNKVARLLKANESSLLLLR
jgi:nucleotide-binding universal stress UspA family protein